jgi:3-oxoacyl-[acyl-carrier-protein] synthase-3
MPDIGINAIGMSVPKIILTNKDLEKMVDTTDEWIVSRTGIKQRFVLGPNGRLRPIVSAAARTAMERGGLTADKLDFIISSTVIPDRFCPAQSYEIAHDLKAENAFCFDLNAACCGFLYGLACAESFLKTRNIKAGLVTTAEQMTTVTDYTDRNNCVLFGDAAAAAVVTNDHPQHRILYTELGSTPGLCEDVIIGGAKELLQNKKTDFWFRQNGRTVFKFAVSMIKELFETVPKKAGIKPDQIRYVIPHQANSRITEAAAESALGKGAKAEFISVIEKYGNTSSVSIGLGLHESWSRFHKGDYILLVAFGGGLSWAAALLQW